MLAMPSPTDAPKPIPALPSDISRSVKQLLSVVGACSFLLSLWLFITALWGDPDYLWEVQKTRRLRPQVWGELLQDLETPSIKRALQQADRDDVEANLGTYRWRQAGYGGLALLLGCGTFSLRASRFVRNFGMSGPEGAKALLGIRRFVGVKKRISQGREEKSVGCAEGTK